MVLRRGFTAWLSKYANKIFSHNNTSTEQSVEATFLYHTGLLYRCIQRVLGRSYEAVRQLYHWLACLFDPESDYHSTVAIDFM